MGILGRTILLSAWLIKLWRVSPITCGCSNISFNIKWSKPALPTSLEAISIVWLFLSTILLFSSLMHTRTRGNAKSPPQMIISSVGPASALASEPKTSASPTNSKATLWLWSNSLLRKQYSQSKSTLQMSQCLARSRLRREPISKYCVISEQLLVSYLTPAIYLTFLSLFLVPGNSHSYRYAQAQPYRWREDVHLPHWDAMRSQRVWPIPIDPGKGFFSAKRVSFPSPACA